MKLKLKLFVCTVLVAMVPVSAAHAAKRGLTYSQAKHAIQVKADKLAGTPTNVDTLLNLASGRYYGQAKWSYTDPTGCKGCGFDDATGALSDTPLEHSCWAGFRASRSAKTHKVVVAITEKMCG